MKLSINVMSGSSADGFDTIITDNDEIVHKESYYYGFHCSHNKEFASERAPYISDLLQDLIDKYQVTELSVGSGKNLFAGKDVDSSTVEHFKNKYCTDLQLADDIELTADDLAGISEMDKGMNQ